MQRRRSLQMLTRSSLQLERERDDLLRRQKDAVLELQQKISLKEQRLQKKIAELRETLEKREAQLYAVLSTSSLDPPTASQAAQKLQVPLSVWLSPLVHHRPAHWLLPDFRTFWSPKKLLWRPCRGS